MPSPYQVVVDLLNEHWHEPDIQGIQALYAGVAAHNQSGQPVWPMLVAPPGSLKTEMLESLRPLPGVHTIDAMTPKTFLSGALDQGRQDASLLHRIGKNGILICSDFSTVLGMKSDDRALIFADLRRIYDGSLRKEFGTSDGVRKWAGRITFVVGATPDVDMHLLSLPDVG